MRGFIFRKIKKSQKKLKIKIPQREIFILLSHSNRFFCWKLIQNFLFRKSCFHIFGANILIRSFWDFDNFCFLRVKFSNFKICIIRNRDLHIFIFKIFLKKTRHNRRNRFFYLFFFQRNFRIFAIISRPKRINISMSNTLYENVIKLSISFSFLRKFFQKIYSRIRTQLLITTSTHKKRIEASFWHIRISF